MTLQVFGPRMQQPQSVSSQLGWLCCTTVRTIILPATLSTARAEHRWEGLERATLALVGALKWKVGYNVRLKGRGLFPSFPVSFNISSMSRPLLLCTVNLAICTATKPQHFLYFWLCGEGVNFPLYQEHDFTHSRVDVGEDSQLRDGDEGKEEQNTPVRESFLTVGCT